LANQKKGRLLHLLKQRGLKKAADFRRCSLHNRGYSRVAKWSRL
jgi:hypothetical protein